MKRLLISAFASVFVFGVGFFTVRFLYAQTPQAPNLSTVNAPSACRTELQWTQPQGPVDEFIISWKINNGSYSADWGLGFGCSSNCSSISYVHEDSTVVVPETLYTYRVKSRRIIGVDSPWSQQEKSATTPAIMAPNTPILGGNSWNSDGTKLTINWNQFALKNGGYRVYHSETGVPGASDGVSLIADDTVNFYEDFLSTSTPHYFSLKAFQTDEGCVISDVTKINDGRLAKFSGFSPTLIVPATPGNLQSSVTPSGTSWRIDFSWGAASGADRYELQYTTDPSFSSPTTQTVVGTTYSETVSQNRTIYWRVRAVRTNNGVTGVSDYAKSATSVGLNAPNLSVSYPPFNPTVYGQGNIAVKLSWEDNTSIAPRAIEIFEDSGAGYPGTATYTVTGNPPPKEYSLSLASGKLYTYKARVRAGTAGSYSYSGYSTENVSVDLRYVQKDKEFSGYAWSAHKDISTGETGGVGWISFSSSTGSGISVFTDPTGLLWGQAWGATTGAEGKYRYGWLSFTQSTLAGCPSGSCEARLDKNTGAISGWGKFTDADGQYGWVSLRGNGYGVCYGGSTSVANVENGIFGTSEVMTGATCAGDGSDVNKDLSGLMWGGLSGGGWFAFTTGTLSPSGVLSINPSGPVNLAIFEKIDFSATAPVTWYVGTDDTGNNAVKGGTGAWGTVVPNVTATVGAPVIYSADRISGNYYVFASSSVAQASAQVSVGAPYEILQCTSNEATSMGIAWRERYGNWTSQLYTSYAPHTRTLFFAGVPKGSAAPTDPLTTALTGSTGTGTGDYLQTSLATSTDYYYQVKTTYGNGYATTTRVYGPCRTYEGKYISDIPSRTKVFAVSPTLIYVNWKDNATTTAAYTFEVQRIKVTPATSTQFSATSTSASFIRLEWKNNTTSTPYYHELEQTTSTSGQFTSSDTSSTTIEVYGHNDITPLPANTNKYFSFDDNSVVEATTYFYRIRSCSTIDLSKAYTAISELKKGGVEKPPVACSKYTYSRIDESSLVSTTTLPKAPTDIVVTPLSRSSIRLSWTDNSAREHGFEIKRTGGPNGVATTTVAAKSGVGGTVTYTDNGFGTSANKLSPGVEYSYEIKTYRTIDDGGPYNGQTVYSTKISGSGYTYFVVNASVSPPNGGSVGDTTGVISCPGTCDAEFRYGTLVTLNAAENAHYYFSRWTGVTCNGGNNSPVCSFTGNANPQAIFEEIQYLLSVSPSGRGKITGTGGINCSDQHLPGEVCSVNLTEGTNVLLSASTRASSTFIGWTGGGCTGVTSTSCSFPLNSAESVIATFAGGIGSILRDVYATVSNGLQNVGDAILKSVRGDKNESEGENRPSMFANIIESIRGFYTFMKDRIAELTGRVGNIVEYTERKAEEFAVEQARVVHGAQSQPSNLDKYFEMTSSTVSIPSLKDDKNLDPDTVYAYRVRLVYSEAKKTNWDFLGATKTLRDISGGSVEKHPVCTRNSYCDYEVPGYKSSRIIGNRPEVEESEQQCETNSNCRDIGRGGQIYQER